MDFQKIMLADYLQTESGRHTAEFFENFRDHYLNRFANERFFDFVLGNLDCAPFGFYLTPDDEFMPVTPDIEFADFDQFMDACYRFFQREDFKDSARGYQGDMPQLSCILFALYPDLAFPYLFPVHFYKFREVCENLGISLPPMPTRNDHVGRCLYIFDIMEAMHDFRTANELTPVEMCSLIYGFAPRFLVSYVKDEPLPANRVCIVGATKDDAESDDLQYPREGNVIYWQGNDEMTPGDIVLVYETSPYSRIRTIWRAVSPGYDDPFHYFSGKVIVGHPMEIPTIKFKDLADDPVWGKKGLVKGHMIGVRGQSCSVEEYEALKRLIRKKDPNFPLETLPMPPEYAQFYHENLKVERDVETQLLEPLLEKLGYSSSDWVRQLELRMGRGDRVFPDYAIGVKGDRNNRSADFIWEAKYRIPSNKQLEVDFGQAKSYALRLQAKALGLVSIEGVWVVDSENGFVFSKLKKYSWTELQNPVVISKLRLLFKRA